MALHNLKIIVVDGGRRTSSRSSGSASQSKEEKEKNKNSPLYKILNAKKTIKSKVQSGMSPSAVFAMDMGLRVAGQLVKQTANYYISDIGRKNGDSNYQAIINRQIEVISDGLGFANGIISGAATGSMFGLVGAGVGAVVGAISSAVSVGFKYAERERTYQHELFKQDNNQAYNLARTSFQGFTGRLRWLLKMFFNNAIGKVNHQ